MSKVAFLEIQARFWLSMNETKCVNAMTEAISFVVQRNKARIQWFTNPLVAQEYVVSGEKEAAIDAPTV